MGRDAIEAAVPTASGADAASRPVRVAQRSNQTVTSGGTAAARASAVVPRDQPSTRAATRATTT